MIKPSIKFRILNTRSMHRIRGARDADEEMRQILKLVFPTFDIRHSIFVVLQP